MKVNYPTKEPILIVRPSLKKISLDISPAAYLLSALLYWQGKAEEQEEPDYHIFRTQNQLVKDMCNEVSDKTIHDVAVPTLQLLGYLDMNQMYSNGCYTLHMDKVIAAMEAYKKGFTNLLQLLKTNERLEKVLINGLEEVPIIRLEKFLLDKKKFQSQLEKVLITIRKSSNQQSGRKASMGAVGNAPRARVEIREINTEINIEINACEETHEEIALSEQENEVVAPLPFPASPTYQVTPLPVKPAAVKRIPPTRGHPPLQVTLTANEGYAPKFTDPEQQRTWEMYTAACESEKLTPPANPNGKMRADIAILTSWHVFPDQQAFTAYFSHRYKLYLTDADMQKYAIGPWILAKREKYDAWLAKQRHDDFLLHRNKPVVTPQGTELQAPEGKPVMNFGRPRGYVR